MGESEAAPGTCRRCAEVVEALPQDASNEVA
ncbi:MAG: hypothetical protein P8X61_07580 [Limibacillus sp.]